MAFLRSSIDFEPSPVVKGDGIWLRVPVSADYGAWAELRALSRMHLTPWEPAWTRDELSRAAFRRRLRHYQRGLREDAGYSFFIFADDGDGALLGGVSLSNVRRGVTQAVSMGYWVGAPYAGQGLMTRAVRATLPFVFGRLGLHRAEAACMPSNHASIRVLEKTGFEREGLARDYLCINGAWRDHILFSCLEADLPAGKLVR